MKKVVKEQNRVIAGKKKKSASRHMTVRIPRGMAIEVERFLNTAQAEKLGFDSKADVVSAAIRLLLKEYGYYREYIKAEKKITI